MSFDLDKAKAFNAATTESVKQQMELSKESLANQLDAADRIIMRKAADVAIQLAEMPETDPT